MKRGKRKRRLRTGTVDRHHLTSKDYYRRHGQPIDNSPQNVCFLKVGRHRAYHALFLVLSLEEAIEALHERGSELQQRFPDHWAVLFYDRSPKEAIAFLHRFHRIKGRCTRSLTGVCLLEVRYDHRRQEKRPRKAAVPQGVSRVHIRRNQYVPQPRQRAGSHRALRRM